MATQAAHVIDRPLETDPQRDALLTLFGRATLADRYLLPGEGPQDLFARVARAYADDTAHAQRLYDYMSRLWFMPATPILSNGGTDRGLPISCFLNAVEDDLGSIVDTWTENVWLAVNGGGIGTYWGGVRSIGEPVRGCGHTSGIIPFVRVMDSLTLAISQGSLRRGSAAVYIDVHHPEIEEFVEIRKPSGDFNRKSLNLHHGVCITDEFMHAVRDDEPFALRSPHTGEPLRDVSARLLWQRLLETRLQTGEPYLLFVDTANRQLAPHQRAAGLAVRQSNLCSEILLPTGRDHLGHTRTAVCCLASVNLERWDEWCDDAGFVEDVLRMLDNVLEDFIERAPPAWPPRTTRRAASAPWDSARWAFTRICSRAASRSRARSHARRTCACSAICAARPTPRRGGSQPSAARAPTRPSAALPSASATSSRSRRRRASA